MRRPSDQRRYRQANLTLNRDTWFLFLGGLLSEAAVILALTVAGFLMAWLARATL